MRSLMWIIFMAIVGYYGFIMMNEAADLGKVFANNSKQQIEYQINN